MDEHPETIPPSPEAQNSEDAASEVRTFARFGHGCLPDPRPEHVRALDVPVHALFGAPVGVPAEASLERFLDRIPDQSITESCVGFAFAMAIYVRCRAMGMAIEWPAARAIYDVARVLGREDKDQPLVDDGSVPAYAAEGIAEVGVPRERDWPFDPARINEEPDLEVLGAASAFKVTGWARVTSSGASRVADVKHAIANGYPVVTCNLITQAFEDYDGSKPVGAQRDGALPILGGHATVLLGYRASGLLVGATSWTPRWGKGGFYECTEDFVTEALDQYVVTCTQSGVRR